MLSIAESPLKRVEDEVYMLAKIVSDNYDDMEVRNTFFDLILQITLEQPFKIPFVAAVVLALNGLNRGEEAIGGKGCILEVLCHETEARVKKGEWRDVKLLLRVLGCLQGILEDEGVFTVLTELFERAVDLQTASSDDVSLA
jgi:nuclear cap-binding protein subunit 1